MARSEDLRGLASREAGQCRTLYDRLEELELALSVLTTRVGTMEGVVVGIRAMAEGVEGRVLGLEKRRGDG